MFASVDHIKNDIMTKQLIEYMHAQNAFASKLGVAGAQCEAAIGQFSDEGRPNANSAGNGNGAGPSIPLQYAAPAAKSPKDHSV